MFLFHSLVIAFHCVLGHDFPLSNQINKEKKMKEKKKRKQEKKGKKKTGLFGISLFWDKKNFVLGLTLQQTGKAVKWGGGGGGEGGWWEID